MTEPIRVLHVVTIMNRGGLETMLMNYYRHIDRTKVQFDFLVHRAEQGAYDDEIRSMGGRIYRVPPMSIGCLCKYWRELNNFFSSHHEYQIVHSHLDSLSTLALRAARKNAVPVRIAHSHSSGFLDGGIRKMLKQCSKIFLNNSCTHFFACGQAAGAFMFGRRVIEEGSLVILRNAIDINRLRFSSEKRSKIREKLAIAADDFVLGHTGRFTFEKNHKFLIDVFFEVVKNNPKAKLILLGEGSLCGQIKDTVRSCGLDNKVFFCGSVQNVDEYLSAMDVFVFPSLSEGLGMAAIEAQAAGLPVIASSAVPSDIAITENVYFVSLKASPKYWAQTILSYTEIPRSFDENSSAARSYEINNNVMFLQNFYLNSLAPKC